MAENELNALARACLRGRNADWDGLKRGVNACVSERKTAAATIDGRFTVKDSRAKLHRP